MRLLPVYHGQWQVSTSNLHHWYFCYFEFYCQCCFSIFSILSYLILSCHVIYYPFVDEDVDIVESYWYLGKCFPCTFIIHYYHHASLDTILSYIVLVYVTLKILVFLSYTILSFLLAMFVYYHLTNSSCSVLVFSSCLLLFCSVLYRQTSRRSLHGQAAHRVPVDERHPGSH